MTIRYGGLYSDIVFELEADVLDFDTNKLKAFFIDIMFLSKFICIESRTNGKLAMIVELELFKRK